MMIYLVDFTTHSKSEVTKLKERLQAKIYNPQWEYLCSLIMTDLVLSYANAIWLFVRDDSPFTGEWVEKLMSQRRYIRMDNSFFVHLNRSPYIDTVQYRKTIEEKFGRYKDHVHVISPDNKEHIDALCEQLLCLECK